MADFGIFAQDMMLKVTNTIYRADNFWKIPCSAGFKQRDKNYVNEWFDVLVFSDNFQKADLIEKGDKIKVSGRVNLTEWADKTGNKKKSWQILASDIRTDKPQGEDRPKTTQDDIPF